MDIVAPLVVFSVSTVTTTACCKRVKVTLASLYFHRFKFPLFAHCEIVLVASPFFFPLVSILYVVYKAPQSCPELYSMLEKLFHALWQKESVRHPHPFLQGMYLNFGGFSTFSSEPAGCLDAFFSFICSLQWHSTLSISGTSFLCAFWRVSSNFLRLAWLCNCFRCAFPAWPRQIIISASGLFALICLLAEESASYQCTLICDST